MTEVLTVKDLSKRLGINLMTAYKLVKREGFPMLRIGKRIIVTADALEIWLKENQGKTIRVRDALGV